MVFTQCSRKAAPLLSIIGMCLISGMAHAQSFTNSSPIFLDDESVANPYPSTITVSGIASPIESISVTLNGFSHTFPDDVGLLLVGPTGTGQIIFDGGTNEEISNANLTFADGGADWPGDGPVGSGTYQPTAWYDGDTFPNAPVIAGVNPTVAGVKSFSDFTNTNANGVWSLYAVDFFEADAGVISGGWTLNITPASAIPAPSGLLVFGAGLIGLIGSRRRSSKKK